MGSGEAETRTNQWLRVSGFGALYRGVFLRLDLEITRGDDVSGPRALVETGYRF